MDLTARHIHEKQFHDAWRGYNQEEVDEFLDRVAESLSRLERENHALHGRLRELDQMVEASRSTEEMLKKTLVTAQKAAEEAIATARSKAEHLVAEAEERARRANDELKTRVATAEDEVRRKTAEVEREQEARQREIQATVDRLESYETEIKRRLKSFLEQQLKGLEALVEKAPPPQVQAPAGDAPHVSEAEAEAAPAQADAVEVQEPPHEAPAQDAPPVVEAAHHGHSHDVIDVMDDDMDFEGYVREGESDTRRRPLRTLFRRNDREGEDWAEESTR